MLSSEAFSVGEMIFDEGGKPVDYILAEVNPAFEKLIGLSRDQILGKISVPSFPM